LLSVYLHVFQITGRDFFREIARKIIGFVNAKLYDEDGGYFYSSQEAKRDYFTRSIDQRAELPAPAIDRTLHSDANALMASAYFEAARVLDDSSLQSKATSTVGTLGGELFEPGQGIYHLRKAGSDELQQPARLADQAYTVLAFMDAYQTTARPTYLTRARILAEFALEKLFDDVRGRFLNGMQNANAADAGTLNETLSENSAMADALTRLGHFTGEEKYRAAAEKSRVWFAQE